MMTLDASEIRKVCAKATGYSEEVVFSSSRVAPLPFIRSVAAYLMRKSGYSWRQIAEAVGWNNHSCAIQAERRVNRVQVGRGYKAELKLLKTIKKRIKTPSNEFQTKQGV